jgi:hypothetical protein
MGMDGSAAMDGIGSVLEYWTGRGEGEKVIAM